MTTSGPNTQDCATFLGGVIVTQAKNILHMTPREQQITTEPPKAAQIVSYWRFGTNSGQHCKSTL
jgi:hypothetical protein